MLSEKERIERAARIAQILLIRELQRAGVEVPEAIGNAAAARRRAKDATQITQETSQ